MADKKVSFSERKVYPVIFMIIVSLIIGLILSVFYHSTKERIAAFAELRYKGSILSLFDLPVDDVELSYQKYIKELSIDDYVYYRVEREGDLLGYCFYIAGNGLWGSITALVAVDESLQNMIGIDILEQNETPGLGGRITEDSFLSQFRGKSLIEDGIVIQYGLIPESEKASPAEVNQITGATSSSKAVVDMLYRSFREIADTIYPNLSKE